MYVCVRERGRGERGVRKRKEEGKKILKNYYYLNFFINRLLKEN